MEQKKRLPLSELYLLVDEELRQLQEDLKKLEETALKIAPFFEDIEGRLDKLQQHIQEERSPLLSRRLATLRFQLKTLALRHNYQAALFANLHESLRRARRKAPREIVPNYLLKHMSRYFLPRAKIEKETEAATEATTKAPTQDSLYFILLKNGTMNFLLPGEKIVWQRKLPNRQAITLRLPANIAQERVTFTSLPGQDPLEPIPSHKIGILSESSQLGRFATLADKVTGSLRLSSQLFKQKLNFLKVKDTTYEAYLVLHGNRFFLRKEWLHKIKNHLQQNSFTE